MPGVAPRFEDLDLSAIEPATLRDNPALRSDYLSRLLDSCANEYFDDPLEGLRSLIEIAQELKAVHVEASAPPAVRPEPRRPRPFALGRELAVYRARLPEFLETHPGEHVLIKGDEVVGFFASFEEALDAAYRRFGNVPFFIKQVGAEDVVFLLPRTL